MIVPNRLLFLLISAFIISAECKVNLEQLKKLMKPFKLSCIRKYNIDPEVIDNTAKGIFVEEESLMCFFRCFLEMMSFMKDGRLLSQVLIDKTDSMVLPETADRINSMVRVCGDRPVTPDDLPCEEAYLFWKCFYKTDPEVYLLA